MVLSRCAGVNATGEPCQAQPVRPSGFCFWHDPDLAAERDRKRREGGRNKASRVRARKALPHEPLTVDELRAYVSVAFKSALTGKPLVEGGEKVDPALLNALSTAARTLTELARVSELEERLSRLERA